MADVNFNHQNSMHKNIFPEVFSYSIFCYEKKDETKYQPPNFKLKLDKKIQDFKNVFGEIKID